MRQSVSGVLFARQKRRSALLRLIHARARVCWSSPGRLTVKSGGQL